MSKRLAVSVVVALGGVSAAHAQRARDSVRLEEIVVVGSRVGETAKVRTRAADGIGAKELSRRQIGGLAEALRLLPGVGLVGTGAAGGVASTFLRGTNSNHTLLMVDGIRINDANTSPASILGAFDFGGADRLEVVRGPASSLYGGSAIGGTIAVDAAVPENREWQGGARAEAGSFGSVRASLNGAGRALASRLGWTASGTFFNTDNERPHNDFEQRSQQLKAVFAASDRITLGASFRGMQHSFDSPGDIRSTNTTPGGSTEFENNLGTATVGVRPVKAWASRLILGLQEYFIRGTSRFNGGDEFVSRLTSNRKVVDWQNEVRPARQATILFGADLEWNDVSDTDADRTERLNAGYGQISLHPTETVTIDAGARIDDYSTFDQAVTGQLAASYFIAGSGTKLRGSYGSGFLPPALTDRYGSPFQEANPELRPEHSHGWDVGVDQFVASGRGVASITVFGNSIKDLIGFEGAEFPALGKSVNVGRARTHGVEVSGRVEAGQFDLRGGYTYLKATNESEPNDTLKRLIRRPTHTVSADLSWSRSTRASLGGGLFAALDGTDTDFNVFPFVRIDPGNYLDARLYGTVRISGGLTARARVENLFGKRYEAVWGFPALGRRFMMGLDYQH